ncbi:MAG: acyl carrier protein [Planctomycetes bacterium]|nr:acyl carrier protein [Planctomycetota bacterium]
MATSLGEIETKIIDIVAKKLDIEKDKIKKTSHFINDLGADSLDTVELIMEIEDAFNINIPDEDAQGIQVVQDAINYVSKKIGV